MLPWSGLFRFLSRPLESVLRVEKRPGIEDGHYETILCLVERFRSGTITRPEGIDLMWVAGQPKVLFVEDRYHGTGYATRNAVHWPVSILGPVQ